MAKLSDDDIALLLIQRDAEEYRLKHHDRDADADPSRSKRRREDDRESYRDHWSRGSDREGRKDHRGRDEGEPLCYVCGELGHMARDCTKKRNRGGERGACFKCGQHGHYSRDCPQGREEGDRGQYQWGRKEDREEKEVVREDTVNYEPSGALADDGNADTGVLKNGVKMTWISPPEARVPKKQWRLYVFKGEDIIEEIELHKASSHLLGKDRRVADIPADHPSISKQHAVIVFRSVENDAGKKVVRPYVIDLTSTNGTNLNGDKIEDSRYYELKEKDVLKGVCVVAHAISRMKVNET